MSSCRRFGWAVVASVFVHPVVCAKALADDGGGLVGWVESTRGAPVAGAVVSIFGKGIRGGSLLTLADSQGHFALPSLPAGSYTLRAIGTGHQPSAAQHVTVLPNRDALFTLSLTPVGEKPADEAASTEAVSEGEREWKWLVRHKQRSVLETADHGVRAARERAGAGASRAGRARGPRTRGRQHGARGDGGLPVPWPTPRERGCRAGSALSGCRASWSTASGGAWAGWSPRTRGGPGARRRSSCSSPAAGTRWRSARATGPATCAPLSPAPRPSPTARWGRRSSGTAGSSASG